MDIVTIGDATLYHGDCLEILPTLDKVDAVVTDPPYGIGIDGQKENICRNPKHSRKYHEALGWDEFRPHPKSFIQMFSLSKDQVIWGGNYFVDRLPYCKKGWLYWDKGQNGLTMSDGELAYTSLDKPLRAIKINRSQLRTDGAVHPTQKPVRLMEWSIDQLNSPQSILDPFMGSGTTGVACANLQRKFIGIELERKYFDISCERIEAAYAQGRLFA